MLLEKEFGQKTTKEQNHWVYGAWSCIYFDYSRRASHNLLLFAFFFFFFFFLGGGGCLQLSWKTRHHLALGPLTVEPYIMKSKICVILIMVRLNYMPITFMPTYLSAARFWPGINPAILWQKEATLENEISRQWAKCVCHVHWHQCNITIWRVLSQNALSAIFDILKVRAIYRVYLLQNNTFRNDTSLIIYKWIFLKSMI